MNDYIIGIDTGGTCTDAVLIHKQSGEIIATTKKATTHYNLSVGTGNALISLLEDSQVNPEQVQTVAVSSTLATNSVVENKGARVAVIVIGYVKHFKLPVKAVVFVKGGHTIHGKEEEPLDLEYLVTLIEGLEREVDAYGVCSAMSMKNPAHELVTEKAITMLNPKPVFCSHRISNLAGMQERAATAGLHAKLMPVMAEFITGVQKAMEACKLPSNLVVIGGNGEPVGSKKAVTEAALTVASGPACSAHFGALHSMTDCLVIDVGGTTTDIAMIENGKPLLAPEGCKIGRWNTHVDAVDMHTIGIGGDSHVQILEKGHLIVGPRRVIPLSMANHTMEIRDWLGNGDNSRLIGLYPEIKDELSQGEIVQLLKENGPLTPACIREKTGLGGIPLDTQLEYLNRKQLIFECGFTPTDALHVLGLIDIGDINSGTTGAEILGKTIGKNSKEFAEMVLAETEERIENMVIDYIIHRFWKNSLTSFISSRRNHPVLGVDFSVKLPIVGIGAAAKYLLPEVAKNLKTELLIPENCAVGNGIGAAIIGLSL